MLEIISLLEPHPVTRAVSLCTVLVLAGQLSPGFSGYLNLDFHLVWSGLFYRLEYKQ